ncbi:hypothetical protein [Peribacillus glennii]
MDCLLDRCKNHKIDILIPGLDDELYNISSHNDKFLEIGLTHCS